MALIPEDRKLELLLEGDMEALTDEQVAELLPFEITKWEKAGIHPSNVGHDIFALDAMLHSVFDLFISKELLTREEVDTQYRRTLLNKLHAIRIQQVDNALKESILKGVNIQVPKDILGGNGGI